MLFSIPRDFIFFSLSFTKWADNLFSLVLEILKNNKYKNRKKYSDPPTSCPILLVIRTFSWIGLVLNFFHISSSSADLCSECFVTISAFDYRLHHHLIYFFFPLGQHISFIEQHSETWKSNLCFSLRERTFIW